MAAIVATTFHADGSRRSVPETYVSKSDVAVVKNSPCQVDVLRPDKNGPSVVFDQVAPVGKEGGVKIAAPNHATAVHAEHGDQCVGNDRPS
jgi:hypothetical protein